VRIARIFEQKIKKKKKKKAWLSDSVTGSVDSVHSPATMLGPPPDKL
jgi:hypothetical protein